MEKINTGYSLFNNLDSFWPELPSSLVNQSQLDLLKEKSHFFPPVLRIGIECRMNKESQVDLQQCLYRDKDDLTSLAEWLQSRPIENNDEWQALLRFFKKWIDHSGGYHEHIEEVFFEMDILPGARRVPLLFFSLKDPKSCLSTNFLIRVLQDTLGRERPFYPALRRCFECCPENASIFLSGYSFPGKSMPYVSISKIFIITR